MDTPIYAWVLSIYLTNKSGFAMSKFGFFRAGVGGGKKFLSRNYLKIWRMLNGFEETLTKFEKKMDNNQKF